MCKICNTEVRTSNWLKHLRSKTHLKNSPDEIIEPPKSVNRNILTRLCEKCNVEIVFIYRNAWINHLSNEPDECRKPCKICNLEVSRRCWSYHLKSKTHKENDHKQVAKLLEYTRLCEKCNVKVARNAWNTHL